MILQTLMLSLDFFRLVRVLMSHILAIGRSDNCRCPPGSAHSRRLCAPENPNIIGGLLAKAEPATAGSNRMAGS